MYTLLVIIEDYFLVALCAQNLSNDVLHRRSALLQDIPIPALTSSNGSHYEPIEFYGIRENEVAPGVKKEEKKREKVSRRSVSPQGWLEITDEHINAARFSTESG